MSIVHCSLHTATCGDATIVGFRPTLAARVYAVPCFVSEVSVVFQTYGVMVTSPRRDTVRCESRADRRTGRGPG